MNNITLYMAIQGRLGNAMFQYAFAKYLMNLGYTVNFFQFYNKDYYKNEVKAYDEHHILHEMQKNFIENIPQNCKVLDCRWKNSPWNTPNDNILNIINTINQNLVLLGYWQNGNWYDLKFLNSIFQFDELIKNNVLLKYNDILSNSKKTCAVHIRRTDYINSTILNWHMSDKSLFFENSINRLKSDDTQFLIFSDDILWCKEKFKNINNIIYEDRGLDPESSLYLMTLCNKYIITGSTFAWWGAALSKDPETIIYGCLDPNCPEMKLKRNEWTLQIEKL